MSTWSIDDPLEYINHVLGAGEKLAGMLKQPGVMVVLPGHDMPCDLEADADCIAKARPFFNLPEATTDGTSAATTTTYEEGGTER